MSKKSADDPRFCAMHALALLGRFPRLFAILAANRERQRPQPRLGDFLAALEAVAVGAFVQPPERLVDLVERLRLHLDEGELDVFLDVDFGALALVEHLAVLAAVGPHVANPALHLVHQLAAAVLEHLLQLVVPALFAAAFVFVVVAMMPAAPSMPSVWRGR